MYKAVVFDFDGTIIDTENTYTTLLISIFPFMVCLFH